MPSIKPISIFLLVVSTIATASVHSQELGSIEVETTDVAPNLLSATRLNEENVTALAQSGPDATGGIGDWHISNGTLCATVSDIPHEGQFSHQGGTLIDLGYCGRADDHFTTAQDLLGGQTNPVDIHSVKFDQGDDWVGIVTQGKGSGVSVKTTYRLDHAKPSQLQIAKKITVVDSELADFAFYTPFWFNYHSLETFIFSSDDFSRNKGFDNVDFVTRGSDAITDAAHSADTIIFMSPPESVNPISYGWQLESAFREQDGERYALPKFVLSDETASALFVLVDSLYFGNTEQLGLLQLLQIPLLGTKDGAILHMKENIVVGNKADAASVSDQLLPDGNNTPLHVVTAQTDDLNTALHITTDDGAPVTFARPNSSGKYEFALPQGNYQITMVGSANRQTVQALNITDSGSDLGKLKLPAAAKLNLPSGEAMRLVFEGLDGTPAPDFDDRLTRYSVEDDDGKTYRQKVSQVFLAGVEGDKKSVELAPGKYRVTATKGIEHELSVAEVTIEGAETIELELNAPARQISTPGYIAADFHVHTGLSFDNTFSERERVRTFVAENGEIMVSSEHDKPADFTPLIHSMGVQDKVRSIPAVEMTSIQNGEVNPYTGGHANFFPVKPNPKQFSNGMVNHEARRMRDVLHDFKHQHPEVVSQLNHARRDLRLSGEELPSDWQDIIENGQYLDHMGVAGKPYNPHKKLDHEHNHSLIEPHPETGVRDLDFDAMEVINPGGKRHRERMDALRLDWLSFVKQGERISATANSDSHHANEQVAVPRNMVAVSADSVSGFDQAEFLAAIKAGNFYGTTGPAMQLNLSGTQMGGTFQGQQAILKIKIESVDWVPADELRVQINGETKVTQAVQLGAWVEIPLSFDQDSFVTVEVEGPASERYQKVYKDLFPYAYSNPIYVDYNSDGRWQAPGL